MTSEELKETEIIKNEISAFLKKRDDKGNTLLHYVVKSDNEEFAKQLIAAGCDINATNKKGDPPLAVAIREKQLNMVKVLLNAGADCENDRFRCKCGPLHISAEYGCPEIVHLLIKHGVDVDACCDELQTPLHKAGQLWNFNLNRSDDRCTIIKALIDADAYINATDKEGCTPLVIAVLHGFKEGSDLLLSLGAEIYPKEFMNNKFLFAIMLWDDLNALKQLIDIGLDVNGIDVGGDSCLSAAAFFPFNKTIKFLLNEGAKAANVNKKGEDPLFRALKLWPDINLHEYYSPNDEDQVIKENTRREVYENYLECLDILIKHGANVNNVTCDGLTLLYLVLENYKHLHSDFVRLLLKNGAKFDFKHPTMHRMFHDSNGSKFRHLLLRHTAMFEAQDRSDGPSNFDLNCLTEESRKDYARCRDELEHMKSTKIDDTNVNIFNILVNQDIGPLTRNECIRNFFESTNVTKSFPIYSDLLCERFAEEVEFQSLAQKARVGLAYILNWDENSTHLLLDNTLRYLDEKDLINLSLI